MIRLIVRMFLILAGLIPTDAGRWVIHVGVDGLILATNPGYCPDFVAVNGTLADVFEEK